ncbi:hypothetical protein GCM10009787_28330 [Streptomyces bangladeshensis]|uniref:Transposase n=1 Tax=Streptomyces bangladeshensis TaxID=295352 RepID=A0ABN3BHN2_9ACTN
MLWMKSPPSGTTLVDAYPPDPPSADAVVPGAAGLSRMRRTERSGLLSVSLGTAGLGGAWQSATLVESAPLVVSDGLFAVSGWVWLVLLTEYARHGGARCSNLVNDLRHPEQGFARAYVPIVGRGTEQAVTVTDTRLYGKASAQAWDRLHPRLTRRAAWLDHDGPLPIIEGTVIRLVVEKLPSGRVNKPVWLWWSRISATEADVDRCWQSFLRRFDIEHTFRLFKQTLGWTKPRLPSSEAADRWTWLVIAAYAHSGLPDRWPSTSAGPGRSRPSRTN